MAEKLKIISLGGLKEKKKLAIITHHKEIKQLDEYIEKITKYDDDLKLLSDTLDSIARSLKQVARLSQESADARKAFVDSELSQEDFDMEQDLGLSVEAITQHSQRLFSKSEELGQALTDK